MDRIFLEGMRFYGFHGVLPHEKRDGQTFIVDVELSVDLREAGQTDRLEQTVNYSSVFDCIRRIVEQERYDLLEKLASVISEAVLSGFERVEAVTVRIRKPQVPIRGELDWAGVEIRRSRRDA